MRYWTKKDRKDLEKAQTFEDLTEVAMRVLRRIPGEVGIVSGPITTGGLGSREKNLAEMHRTIRQLSSRGLRVFSQMPFEEHMLRIMQTPYYRPEGTHLLDTFYLPIFSSGLIKFMYFMPDWKSSMGANWEHDKAIKLGIKRVYLENFLSKD